MLKVSSLFLGAFFILVAVPSYVKAERPTQEVAGSRSNHLALVIVPSFIDAIVALLTS